VFFSQKTASNLPDVSEAMLDVSRPELPVDSVMSISSSTALSATPSQASKSGIFGRWPKSSPTPYIISKSTTSPPFAPATNDLVLRNAVLQDQFDELKEVADLNRSTLQRLADELANKDHECMELRKSVYMLNAELRQAMETFHHSVKGKDDQLSMLQIELDSIKLSHDNLVHERDQMSINLTTSNEQLASLQHENNVLATLNAAAEIKVSKYNTYVDTFKQQYQALTTSSAQEEQKHEQNVDAMHAQQSEAEQCFQAQLHVKDTVIQSLRAQLDQTELTASKATMSRDDEVAHLKDQLH
jgi:chromosome segregation ATPase